MHPTKFIRAWAAAGLLAGLAALTTGPAAQAQPKAEPPMATPDRTGAISVTIGGQVRFQMKTKKRIREAFNENDRVVQVLADATDPSTLILIGRQAGTSRLEVSDVDGAKESYLIVVQRDVEMLKNLIRRTVPTALVDITPIGDAGTNIIVSGYVAAENDRDTIRQLAEALGLRVAVNTVSVGGGGNVPHVQLDVTLAKVDRTRARSRGANWILNGGTASFGSVLGGITGIQPGAIGNSHPNGLGLGVQPQAPILTPGQAPNLIFGFAPSNFQFLLAALRNEGLAKLVAAPTLVARSGEEAELLIGAQIPVISAASGINGPGVTYRPVGTELRFLPIVYGNGKIHLTVSPRVTRVANSQALTTSFGTSPAFEEQRMTTSVIVEPGQTIAIGGLIQTTSDATITKIPHLGDLPYLGPLFSYATQTEDEQELLVVLTPRLVDPADCSQMPKGMPGSETRKPDDHEFYLESILEAPRGQRQIWQGGEYVPAWKSGPSANLYPCAGNGGCGTGAYGGCADGKCGANGGPIPNGAAPSGATVPVRRMTPGMLPEPPTVHADPLLDPARPERKTAELPQK